MAASFSPSFEDRIDFANAERGFIASPKSGVIKGVDDNVVWNHDDFDFLKAETCPDTVDPKLWRHAQLLNRSGLFQVADIIFQVRGFDLSNITIVEGDRGLIVIDPLVSEECARSALELYKTHRGERPISGLIYTHSHLDHFGGARGVLSPENKDVPIIAPDGFLDSVVSENVYAGPAMARRAGYMYGDMLEKSEHGQVGVGLAMSNSRGTISLIAPNLLITKTCQEEIVDGVRMIFQMTPGTEAPAEMNFYFPTSRALCMAENATHTMHNILTLRGAEVRDSRGWSRYIDESIRLFAFDTDVCFASHHWPTWGRDAIIECLSQQRDLYAYLHDQTLRKMNDGLTGSEIAEEMILPPKLASAWHAQGFYGTVSHNVKAIYQRYLGWYDANPAHLWEHPPEASARRYVSCMGGVSEVLKKGQQFVDKSDLRFAATLLSHAVFAEPANHDAKMALAEVLERLGHGCENATWRNVYLAGAIELRGEPIKPRLLLQNDESLSGLTMEQLLDTVSIRINGEQAHNESFVIDLRMTDLQQRWRLTMSNGALTHYGVPENQWPREAAGLTCTITRPQLQRLLLGQDIMTSLEQRGDKSLLPKLLSLTTIPNAVFKIIEP